MARAPAGVRLSRSGDGGVEPERVLTEHLPTRTTYATTTVGAVADAGLGLLPTFGVPHYDVMLEDATAQEVAKLMSILSQPVRNPHRRKSR